MPPDAPFNTPEEDNVVNVSDQALPNDPTDTTLYTDKEKGPGRIRQAINRGWDKAKDKTEQYAKRQARAAVTKALAANPYTWVIVGVILVVLTLVAVVLFSLKSTPNKANDARSSFQSIQSDPAAKPVLDAILADNPDTSETAPTYTKYVMPSSDLARLHECQTTPANCQIDRRVISLLKQLADQYGHIKVSIIDGYEIDPANQDPFQGLSKEQDPNKYPVISAHALGQAVDLFEVGYTYRDGWREEIPLNLAWTRSNNRTLGLTADLIYPRLDDKLKPTTPSPNPTVSLANLYQTAVDTYATLPSDQNMLPDTEFTTFAGQWNSFIATARAEQTRFNTRLQQQNGLPIFWPRLEDSNQTAQWSAFWTTANSSLASIDSLVWESRLRKEARVNMPPVFTAAKPLIVELDAMRQLQNQSDTNDQAIQVARSTNPQLDLALKATEALKDPLGEVSNTLGSLSGGLIGKKKKHGLKEHTQAIQARTRELEKAITTYDNATQTPLGDSLTKLSTLSELKNLSDIVDRLNATSQPVSQLNPLSTPINPLLTPASSLLVLDDTHYEEAARDLNDTLSVLSNLQVLEELKQLTDPDVRLVNAHDLAGLENLRYLGELKHLGRLKLPELRTRLAAIIIPDNTLNADTPAPIEDVGLALNNLQFLSELQNLDNLSTPYPFARANLKHFASLKELSTLGNLGDVFQNDPTVLQTINQSTLSLLGGREDVDINKPLEDKLEGRGLGLYAFGLFKDPPIALADPSLQFSGLTTLDLEHLTDDTFNPIANLGQHTPGFTPGPDATAAEQAQTKRNQAILAITDSKLNDGIAKELRQVQANLFYRSLAEERTAAVINFALSLPATDRPRQILSQQTAGVTDPENPNSGSVSSETVNHIHFGF